MLHHVGSRSEFARDEAPPRTAVRLALADRAEEWISSENEWITRFAQLASSVAPARERMARMSAATSRRPAIASALYRPCLKAFRLPFGAPVDRPPCIRHRPFGIAACWHGCPVVRQWAPHLGLSCIGNLRCMGLTLDFCMIPRPQQDPAPEALPGVELIGNALLAVRRLRRRRLASAPKRPRKGPSTLLAIWLTSP
jgi:hypothetical protein